MLNGWYSNVLLSDSLEGEYCGAAFIYQILTLVLELLLYIDGTVLAKRATASGLILGVFVTTSSTLGSVLLKTNNSVFKAIFFLCNALIFTYKL